MAGYMILFQAMFTLGGIWGAVSNLKIASKLWGNRATDTLAIFFYNHGFHYGPWGSETSQRDRMMNARAYVL